MSRFSWWAIAGLLIGLTSASDACASGIPDDLALQIKRLGMDKHYAVRLDALKQLRAMRKEPILITAFPALTICTADKNPEIRGLAVCALGEIAHDLRLRCHLPLLQCPFPLLKAVLDEDPEVRSYAMTYVQPFEHYPSEALPIFLRALRHSDWEARQFAPGRLVVVGRHEPKVLAALKQATRDTDYFVRHSAQAALYQITHDLDAWVHHLLTPVWEEDIADPKGNPQTLAIRKASAELIGLGTGMQFLELERERPADLTRILLKHLSDDSFARRGYAARLLGAMAVSGTEAKNVATKLQVEPAIRRLLEDDSPWVRQQAETALQRIRDGPARPETAP